MASSNHQPAVVRGNLGSRVDFEDLKQEARKILLALARDRGESDGNIEGRVSLKARDLRRDFERRRRLEERALFEWARGDSNRFGHAASDVAAAREVSAIALRAIMDLSKYQRHVVMRVLILGVPVSTVASELYGSPSTEAKTRRAQAVLDRARQNLRKHLSRHIEQ